MEREREIAQNGILRKLGDKLVVRLKRLYNDIS